MDEYRLPDDGPEHAEALEIFASIEPRGRTIEVRRTEDQRVPLLMHDGMRCIIARPDDDTLFVAPRAPTRDYRLVVLRWLD